MKFIFKTLLFAGVLFASSASAQIEYTNGVKYYAKVDESPTPPGGMANYYKFLAENIKYPRQALDSNVQGTITIKLYIDSTGNILDTKIIKDHVGYGCAEEALRIVKQTMWNPGKIKGKAVSTTFPISVKFVSH